MDTRCRVRGSDDSRLGFGELGGIGLEAVPDVLRPRIWRPGLYRFCRVGNPSAEQNNRTADHKENLVCAADVHPFLRDTMGGRRVGLFAFRATCRARVDGDVGGAFALFAGRRLRGCRSDSRALQDVLFMRFNTRQVTRVL